MKIVRLNRNIRGIFFVCKKALVFSSPMSVITDNDIESLFIGFLSLVKSTVKDRLEREYRGKIARLEKELQVYKLNATSTK